MSLSLSETTEMVPLSDSCAGSNYIPHHPMMMLQLPVSVYNCHKIPDSSARLGLWVEFELVEFFLLLRGHTAPGSGEQNNNTESLYDR